MTDEPVKGSPGGECGALLCRCKPAFFYHAQLECAVCEGCASDANRRSWLNRSDGSPCCNEISRPVVAVEADKPFDMAEVANRWFLYLYAQA